MKIQLTAPTQLQLPDTVYAILVGSPPTVAAIAVDLQSGYTIAAMIGNGATPVASSLVDN